MSPKGRFPNPPVKYDHDLADRLAKRIVRDEESGCWLWQGATKRGGYGHVSIDDKMRLVHRVMWELTNDAIPEGYEIDHLCKTPGCCNPAHLEPVTKTENLRRGKPEYAPESKVNPAAVTEKYVKVLGHIRYLGTFQAAKRKRVRK